MATVYTPRYIPRARGRAGWSPGPNFAADPLFRLPPRGITPGQAGAGLAFNRSLYAPGTAAMIRPPVAPVVRRGVWTPAPGDYAGVQSAAQIAARMRGIDTQQFPDRGADVPGSFTDPPEPTPPDFSADDSGVGGKTMSQFLPGQSGAMLADGAPALPATGAAGPTGAPPNPLLTNPPEVVSPHFTNPDGSTAMPQSNDQQGMSPSTERFYDRKFGRMSGDPATRMMSRRFGGPTPTVDGSGNITGSSDPRRPSPVVFNNEVAGHSDWSSY